ncbi:MAG: phenylacetate-CoA oxygenase subunit PaaJ [Salibacteraceae bacterium]|nr:phenylacetate-CoA oxygenase subunit PaaJ [Salibacteraceae bacterium]MDP4764299.1 phenylacetate-CoA oxygenase subunit PaaJ [Salibacteraceae bacterium]MDP4842811.1 phenylacetate-CoA oxygenase subunit PaaJ [Salibacteraceae bacterium]MDP4966105.1 phenylacetate-CoA oxygenase subunit PaaJ [Salibacteraceae bacterium]
MVATETRIQQAWHVLNAVEDPEIPVVSIVDLGIVRQVFVQENSLYVHITPTYSGCPATQVIEDMVIDALNAANMQPFQVKTVLSPAWSTNFLTDEGKQKLEAYGIAPPAEDSVDKLALMGEEKQIACPLCKSTDTKMVSQFGSTPCKAHFKCNDCLEPFDYFKCLV